RDRHCLTATDYPELVIDGYARFPRTWRTPRGPRSAVPNEKGQDGRYSRAANEPYLSSGMETITETLEHSVLVVDDEPQVVGVLRDLEDLDDLDVFIDFDAG